jgi:hypothetical protein
MQQRHHHIPADQPPGQPQPAGAGSAPEQHPPRTAVHSPCPTGVSTPRSTWVSTRLCSDRPCMVNSAVKA